MQQIFSCTATGIDRDTSLSDYCDVPALCVSSLGVCVCLDVTVIADHWISII